jgi:alpha-L-arabinofuranosidase
MRNRSAILTLLALLPAMLRAQPAAPVVLEIKAGEVAAGVTRDSKSGEIFVKVVNRAAAAQPVRVAISGLAAVEPRGQSITLSASGPDDTNSITEPSKIVPVTASVDGLGANFTREFPPYSITILQMKEK